MQNIYLFFKKYLKDIIFIILLLLCIGFIIYLKISDMKDDDISNEIATTIISDDKEEIIIPSKIHVDVKGAVKNPGVYEVDDGIILNEVINIAGGFNSNAYKNGINLSKKVKDEMVIYIYTTNEINNLKKENNISNVIQEKSCESVSYNIYECVNNKESIIEINENKKDTNENNNSNNNELININTASLNDLTRVNGIGEAKAKSIIDYRKENGLFKKIEDIMNVNGIGESLFNKIKNYITV